MNEGANVPDIKTVNDYITYIMPICFGALGMTAEEIGNSTPFDINKRIRGYEDRQRMMRVFVASFITLPVINSGFKSPRKQLKLEDVIPEDLNDNMMKSEIDTWREILKNAER